MSLTLIMVHPSFAGFLYSLSAGDEALSFGTIFPESSSCRMYMPCQPVPFSLPNHLNSPWRISNTPFCEDTQDKSSANALNRPCLLEKPCRYHQNISELSYPCELITIPYSLFTIHYLLFTIYYSLFSIHYSLSTIHLLIL